MEFELPEGWRCEPLKFHCLFGKGLSIQKGDLVDSGVAVISYGQIHARVNNGTGLSDDLVRYIPRSLAPEGSFARLHLGDLVYADTSEDIEGVGNAAFIDADEEIYAGYHTLICRPDGGILSGKYLAYLSRSDWWRTQLRSMAMGVKVYSVTQSIMSHVSVLIPPLGVQNRIVQELDEVCGAIDRACSTAEAQLSTLERYRASVIHEAVTRGLDPSAPTKPSGIDWFDAIPLHWKATRITSVADRRSGHTPNKAAPEYWDNGDVVWISLADSPSLRKQKYVHESRTMTTKAGIDHSSAEILPSGSVLLSRDASVGLCAIAGCDLAVSQHFMAYICGPKLCNVYLYYCFRDMQQVFQKSSMGSTIPTIGLPLIKRLQIPLPPLAEQQAIADFLDAHTAAIDAVVATKRKQLDVLKRRRQSLIYEYVTGKRRVGEEG